MYIPIWKVPFKLFHTAIGYIYYLSISLHAGTLYTEDSCYSFPNSGSVEQDKRQIYPESLTLKVTSSIRHSAGKLEYL